MVTPAVDQHLAFVGVFRAGDEAEQGGFAGAVGADQADLLAFLEGGRGLDEHEAAAVLLADVVQANHVSSSARKKARRGLCPRPARTQRALDPQNLSEGFLGLRPKRVQGRALAFLNPGGAFAA